MIDSCRERDRARGKKPTKAVADYFSTDVAVMLKELKKLGDTLNRCVTDVTAYSDRPGTSNGPMEAINGVRNISGCPMSFWSPTNYVLRSLMESGRFRLKLGPQF